MSEQLVRRVIDDGQVSGQQLLVVGLCFLFNTLDGFDITAMAVVNSAVAAELSLTPDRVGWIFGFALAGMMGGAMFLASWSDIIGRRRTIIASILLVGVSITLTARATSLAEFIVLRFVSGLGAGAMLASQATLAAEYSPDRYRALSVAVVTSGYPTGAMLTSVAAGFITPDCGWRGMFLLGGVLTLLMVLFAWLWIPESLKYLFERRPHDALERINTILGKLGKGALAVMPPAEAARSTVKPGFVATMLRLIAPGQRAVTLQLWLAFFMSFSTLYFLLSWLPKLMEDAGFSVAEGREAFFLYNLGGVIGIYVLGLLSTRWMLTNIIFSLMFSSAVGMVVFAMAPRDVGLLLATIFAVGLLQQGGFTGLYGAAAKAYPTAIRSTGIGWCIGLGRSGAVLGPAIAGYLIAGGLDMADNFIAFALPMALAAVLAFRLHIR